MKGESLPGSDERILVAGTWQQTQSIRSGDWKLIAGQRVKGKLEKEIFIQPQGRPNGNEQPRPGEAGESQGTGEQIRQVVIR